MRSSKIALCIITLMIALPFSFITIAMPTHIPNIYIVHNYGGITILTMNRSVFRYIGDGYWLLKDINTDENTICFKALSEIDKVVGNSDPVSIVEVVLTNNHNYEAKNIFIAPGINFLKLTSFMNLVREFIAKDALRRLGAKQALIWLHSNGVIEIEVAPPKELSALSIVKTIDVLHSLVKGHRVVVVETLGFGWMLNPKCEHISRELTKIPCVDGVGEAAFGIYIMVDSACIKRLAEFKGTSFDKELNEVIISIKRMNSLIRECAPYQGIAIVVAKIPKLTPLPLTVSKKSISKEVAAASTHAANHVVTSISEKGSNYSEANSNSIDNSSLLCILITLVIASVAVSIAIALRNK